MSHLRISVPFNVRPEEHQSVKAMSKTFSGINDYVTAVNVQCVVCGLRGRDNSRLKKQRKRTVCNDCQKAGAS